MTLVFDPSAPLPGEDLTPDNNVAKPRRDPMGRPGLTMLERIEVVVAWGEYINKHAKVEVPRPRRQVKALQAKTEAARRNGVAPHLIKRWSEQLDALGRITRALYRPPSISLREVDKAIAKQFGVSVRTVERIRQDRRLWPFMGRKVWELPEWQRKGAALHAARLAAKRLMTPERFAKNERVALVSAGLAVEQEAESEAAYLAARRVFGFLRRSESLLPGEYKRPPTWLALLPQWTRIEARWTGEVRVINEQMVYGWVPHPNGRRVPKAPASE